MATVEQIKQDPKAKPDVKSKLSDSQKPEVLVSQETDQTLVTQECEIERLLLQTTEEDMETLFLKMQKIVMEKKEAKKSTAIFQIQEIAKAAGLSISIKGVKSSKDQTPIIYQNPANADQTFVGKVGARKPEWLKLLLKNGHKIHEFAVKPVQQPASEQPTEEPAQQNTASA